MRCLEFSCVNEKSKYFEFSFHIHLTVELSRRSVARTLPILQRV